MDLLVAFPLFVWAHLASAVRRNRGGRRSGAQTAEHAESWRRVVLVSVTEHEATVSTAAPLEGSANAREHISLCRMSQAKGMKLPEGGHRPKPWINSRKASSTPGRNCTRGLADRIALWRPPDSASTAAICSASPPARRLKSRHHPVRWRRIMRLKITSTCYLATCSPAEVPPSLQTLTPVLTTPEIAI